MEGGWCTNNQRASTSAGGPAVAIRRRATILEQPVSAPVAAAGAARQPPTADALFCLTTLFDLFIFFIFKFPGKYFWLFSFSGSFIKYEKQNFNFLKKLWKQIWI
jgi:hypothetical protein